MLPHRRGLSGVVNLTAYDTLCFYCGSQAGAKEGATGGSQEESKAWKEQAGKRLG